MKYTGSAKREGETLMPLRLCSILGTLLLALAVATPVLAQDKQESGASEDETSATRAKRKRKARAKAKKADEAASADASDKVGAIDKADDSASTDKADGAVKQGKRSKKKGKKAKEEEEEAEKADSEEAATATEASASAEPAPEPDSWERPPEEEEKPPATAVAKPVEKSAGDGKPLSAGLLVGWGFKTDRRSRNVSGNPYGLGAGLRGGYSVPDINLYAGVYFMYYLGSAVTGSSQYVNNATITTNANYMQFGAEIGYDWWVAAVIVRPSVQLGAALVFTDVPNVQSPIGDFMFAPGITVVHPWDDFFIGGDFRANIVTGDGSSSILLAATAGMRF
jgi:hypothetical protein